MNNENEMESDGKIELDGNYRCKCHLCHDPFWPTLKDVSKLKFLCYKCTNGHPESFYNCEKRVKQQTKRRLKLNKACEQPYFMMKFMDWHEKSLETLTFLEIRSLTLTYRGRLRINMSRQIDSGNDWTPPWL